MAALAMGRYRSVRTAMARSTAASVSSRFAVSPRTARLLWLSAMIFLFAAFADPAFAGTLLDAGFESRADGTALDSGTWTLFGAPMRAEYDNLRAKNGAISAWIRGPATISYAGAAETASANMTGNGSEHTFWVYLDNTTQRRLIEDNATTDASKVFTLYFNPTGSALQVYTSRAGNPNGYLTNGYTTVGTWGVGWTQFKITYTFTGTGAQTYTLATRATASDPWTPLKGAGATYDIPFRGTNAITATHGLVFKGYQNTSLWVDDIVYGDSSTSTFDVVSSASPGGSIAPFGTETVAYGGNSSLYRMTPDAGYFLSDVLADGNSVTTGSYPLPEYQFTDVRSYHTVHAVFSVPGTTEMKLGAMTCDTCHAVHNPPGPCERCHRPIGDAGSSHLGVPSDWHTPANVSTCSGCHNSELTYEHNGRKTAAGAYIDCETCHSSTDSDVVAAIASGSSECTSCHTDTQSSHPDLGGSVWTYKDLFDAQPKNEGGYASCSTCHAPGANKNPHGGYDTTTNKCKVCHAVHRAEGAYYLLRADSQDDACNYCHVGASAHSTKIVYDLNPAGTDTTNGHTIGAACSVPDSSVRQYATAVVLSGVDCDGNPVTETVQVRAYDQAKLQMYRFGRHHGQTDEGAGRAGYAKIGPRNLTCMNCHQTHNAIDEVWRPLAWASTGWPSPTQSLSTFEAAGYKLLRRYPSGTTTGTPNAYGYYDPGQQVKVIEGNAVKEGSSGPWDTEQANFSGEYSAKFVYNQNAETAASPVWIAQDIHEPDAASYPTPGTGYYRYPYFNSKYALSYWCADCHNLNLGGWQPLSQTELGFKAHTERTHPAPFYGAYTGPGQCYSCHRNDLSPLMGSMAGGGSGRATVTGRDSCTQCHYGTKDYAIEMGNETVTGTGPAQADLGLDFPHSGRTTDIKLLGSYTIQVPAGGFTSGSFGGGSPSTVVSATITETNLDAVCLRCHPGVGVHQ